MGDPFAADGKDAKDESKLRLVELTKSEWETKGAAIRAHLGVSGLDLPFDVRYDDIDKLFADGGPKLVIVQGVAKKDPAEVQALHVYHDAKA